MNQFEIQQIKILELLTFKFAEWENRRDKSDTLPELALYKDDFLALDMDYLSASHILKYLEERGQIMIDYIRDPLKFDPENDHFDHEDIVNGKLRIIVYNIITSNSIFQTLENLKSGEVNEELVESDPIFNEDDSTLTIGSYTVKIALQDKLTNDHKVLKYILNEDSDTFDYEFFYADIAEHVFNDLEYKTTHNAWKRYNGICKSINDKITKDTKGKISDFLFFNTGTSGRVKINRKYFSS